MLTIPHPWRVTDPGADAPRVEVRRLMPSGLPRVAVEALAEAVPVTEGGLPVRTRELDPAGLPPVPRLHPSGTPTDERYRIEVARDGLVVSFATQEGALRAASTIADQLRAVGSLPLGTISDAPALGWRGLTLDVARRPFPIHELDRIVDILVSLRLNVLHLHLTDDQGWRLPVPARPEIASVGGSMAMHGAGFAYSADEYRAFVRRAARRHVVVVPEIEMPGHVGALVAAIPEVGAGEGVPGAYASRLHLNPDRDATFDVLRDVVRAVRDLHETPYLHVGGDEAFGMPDDAFEQFFRRLLADLGLDGAHLIGWQESVRAGAGIGMMQVWRDLDRAGLVTDPEVRRRLGLLAAADLEELTARGREDVSRISAERRDVILTPALTAYLDRPYAERDTEGRLPKAGLPVYRAASVRDSFGEPLGRIVPGLDPVCIAGAEAALFTETIPDLGTAETMLLPRLAGFAQRAWEHEPSDWADHRDRLTSTRRAWDARGWRHHRVPLGDPPDASGPDRTDDAAS